MILIGADDGSRTRSKLRIVRSIDNTFLDLQLPVLDCPDLNGVLVGLGLHTRLFLKVLIL